MKHCTTPDTTPEERRQLERGRSRVLRAVAARLRSDARVRGDVAIRYRRARVAVGLALGARMTRRAADRVARRACRIMPCYDQLFQMLDLWEAFEIVGIHHLERAVAAGRGAVIAPMHFGRYRWIPIALPAQGYATTIISDTPNLDVHTEFARHDAWQGLYPTETIPDTAGAELVSSESPLALWTLTRALRAGRLVMIYIDGNSGVHGYASTSSSLAIDFLGQHLDVRRGIATMAAVAGSPIIPAVARERRSGAPQLELGEPISRIEGEPRAAFEERAMRMLFAALELEVVRAPDLWEEWHVLPNWIARPPAPHVEGSSELPASIPALAGRRLALVAPNVCAVRYLDGAEVVRLPTGEVVDTDEMAADLVAAAERGERALDWVRECDDAGAAMESLRSYLGRRIVGLVPGNRR